MWRKCLVKKDERALLFRKGDFLEILHPGEYTFFDPFKWVSVETYSPARPVFAHRLADYLAKAEPELAAREFQIVELGATEVGLRYDAGVLVEVLAPNTRTLFWKGYVDVRVERANIASEHALPDSLLVHVATPAARAKIAGADNVFVVQVPQYHVGVFSADGKVLSVLQPGVCTPTGSSAAPWAWSTRTCACKLSKWQARKS